MNYDELRLSFIIPAYNSAQRIELLLNSILQNMKSLELFEIIVVDDGSKDDLGGIIEKFDSKVIRYIPLIENKGVSNARNVGLQNARGKYIQFLDSDDTLLDYDVANLLSYFSNDIDMVMFGFIELNEDGKIEPKFPEKTEVIDKYEAMEKVIFEEAISGFVVNKIFRKELILRENLLLNVNIHYAEDELFVFEYLNYTSKIVVLDKALYQFNLNEDSIRGNIRAGLFLPGNKIKRIFTALDSWEKILNIIDAHQTKLKKEIIGTIFSFGTSIYVKAKRSGMSKDDLKYRKKQITKYLVYFLFNTNKQNIFRRCSAILRIFDVINF